jgi:hypothetical protein
MSFPDVRLARAVRAEQAEYRSLAGEEVDSFQRLRLAEALDQTARLDRYV